ncbi:Coq4 family protein [Parvularcula oceani]|uniref:Coq4 family protein n=1 Tax=Parvularcula oceani TaxID=1247963 RepID=UPI00069231B7|nr:Coq4 family protein [Parvularcula oceani]
MTEATLEDARMPTPLPRNYPRAFKRMYDLTRNKEDTTFVFDVIRAVNGDSMVPAFRRFCASDVARRYMADRPYLLRALDDRTALLALPVGTLGRTYAEFMQAEGLDTNGVQEAAIAAGVDYDLFAREYPAFYAFSWANNLSHDLHHIVSGYGRDGLGETALLAFNHKQTGSAGAAFIAHFGGLKARLDAPRVPVGRIIAEAKRNGRDAEDFVTTDWVPLLERPLQEVRERLKVRRPALYEAVPKETLDLIGQPEPA